MDWHIVLGVAAGVVQATSLIPYVRDIFAGNTKPNAVSWILWTLLQGIALAAQISSGASWSAILLAVMTFNTALISVLALRGYGYKRYGLLDYTCFALALAAIVAWQSTDEPVAAIALVIFADFLAAVPTIAKVYREPNSENLLGWSMVAVAAVMSVFSSALYDAANLAFPIYIVAIAGAIASLIWIRRFALKTRSTAAL